MALVANFDSALGALRASLIGRRFASTRTNALAKLRSDSAMISRGAALMLCEQSVVYDPEELSLFGDVFDRAVASLPAAMCTPFNQAEVARGIFARAAAGERDPSQLELAALMNLTVAVAS
ncbi:hypothetical protein [Bradyrhizobium sp. sBnM-33]|uniref:hypothetical protein n=1 Tax=Bradyrhizobium sp. sBnM-33 TaxID=2831780 RepID=UPI001BCD42F2|nr:hypothetical protein [Bradyrhizobium sp. sBnM-33]WOH46927.1 hypothetical protein RX328_22150 [Bradyrhizobium sp. sBnM-33]